MSYDTAARMPIRGRTYPIIAVARLRSSLNPAIVLATRLIVSSRLIPMTNLRIAHAATAIRIATKNPDAMLHGNGYELIASNSVKEPITMNRTITQICARNWLKWRRQLERDKVLCHFRPHPHASE